MKKYLKFLIYLNKFLSFLLFKFLLHFNKKTFRKFLELFQH